MHVLFVAEETGDPDANFTRDLCERLPRLGITAIRLSGGLTASRLARLKHSEGIALVHVGSNHPGFNRYRRAAHRAGLPVVGRACAPVPRALPGSSPLLKRPNAHLKALAWRYLMYGLNRCDYVLTPYRDVFDVITHHHLKAPHRLITNTATEPELEIYAAVFRHVAGKAATR